jgi:transcription-repair coupling factor (superfamily II helicase)
MYGPLPEEVQRLVDLEEVRVAAGRAGIGSVHRGGTDLTMTLQDVAVLGLLFGKVADPEIRDAGVVRVLDPHMVVWRLREDRGADRALALLKKVLAGFSHNK